MEFIERALAAVSESERELVALLYGFDGPRRAAQDIAEKSGLSLSRVEKTAQRVVRLMRHPTRASLIREALAAGDERIWAALAGATGIVHKSDSLPKAAARVPGDLWFAIECQYGGLEDWLNANARVTERAWYRSPFAEEEIDRLGHALAAQEADVRLPSTIESLASAITADTRAVETAVHLSGGFRTYLGYVAAMPIGARAPRAIRLHQVLSGRFAGQVVPGRRLLSEYLLAFDRDAACTIFDVETALSSYSHLFLRAGDVGWCGIGPAGSRESSPAGFSDDDVTFRRWSDKRRSHKPDADRHVVRQVLEEHGPLRLRQIERLVVKRSDGKIAPESVRVYLFLFDEFVRLAPGVYGLSDHLANVSQSAPPELLLNRGSCLQYIYARWAGEPADAYPMWTPAMEAEWCEWAQARERNLLGSLLAVVEPSAWPAPDSYKDIWLWKKECLGYYQLEKPLTLRLADPPLVDLLALVKCTRWRGRVSWVLANRITGHRILDRGAASLIALLIGLGAVVPASHWQQPHTVAAGAREIDEMLSGELQRKGSLLWNGAAGAALLERLSNTIDRGETGWVADTEMRQWLDRLRDLAAAPSPIDGA